MKKLSSATKPVAMTKAITADIKYRKPVNLVKIYIKATAMLMQEVIAKNSPCDRVPFRYE